MTLTKVGVLQHIHENYASSFEEKGGWRRLRETEIGWAKEVSGVRSGFGLYDAQSMGKILVKGDSADQLMAEAYKWTVNPVPGRATYSCLTNDVDGLLDDSVVYCLDRNQYFICTNTLSRVEVLGRLAEIKQVLVLANSTVIKDVTDELSLISVQGPLSRKVLSHIGITAAVNLKYFGNTIFKEEDQVVLARTGYTGELGFDIFLPINRAPKLWLDLLYNELFPNATPYGSLAAGCLRLEKGFYSLGKDILKGDHPASIGLGHKQKFEEASPGAQPVYWISEGERSLSGDSWLYNKDGTVVGPVTSSTWSPVLNATIGFSRVDASLSYTRRNDLFVEDIHGGRLVGVKVGRTHIYDRNGIKVRM